MFDSVATFVGAGGAGGSTLALTAGLTWWVVAVPFALSMATGLLGVTGRAARVIDKITSSRRQHYLAKQERGKPTARC
jgi:hypothetical protein